MSRRNQSAAALAAQAAAEAQQALFTARAISTTTTSTTAAPDSGRRAAKGIAPAAEDEDVVGSGAEEEGDDDVQPVVKGKKITASSAQAKKKPAVTSGKRVTKTKFGGTERPTHGRKRRSKRRTETYYTYLYRVLKQVHPECGISNRAMSIMDSFVKDTFERIAKEASNLAQINKRSTLSGREIQTAVRLILPGELSKHAVSEGTKAVAKFLNA